MFLLALIKSNEKVNFFYGHFRNIAKKSQRLEEHERRTTNPRRLRLNVILKEAETE